MNFIETQVMDLILVEPKIFEDQRGYFFEAFREDCFKEAGIPSHFIQDNQSKSSFGVLRGLHYQLAPFAQAKLVRVLQGQIFDVAVDLRKNSKTFGQWFGVDLSEDNKKQLFIPKGFAHGFSVLSKIAIVLYKCDNIYNQASERGIFYADKFLNIDWKINPGEAVISAKDKENPIFEQAEMNFL